MDYRLKNISNERFHAEGIDVAPHEVSVELSPELYQRLLSVYLRNPLMPMDEEELAKLDAEVPKEPEAPASVAPTAPSETPPETPEAPKVKEPKAKKAKTSSPKKKKVE